MALNFEHLQSAHCENGVTRSLLKNSGISQITEPLAFGIGAGLFFVYIPFVKLNNAPVIAFRPMPGLIFKRTCKALGIPVVRKKFSSKQQAQAFLDDRLAEGQPVGCQVGVYYLPYFPKEYRFHFNAHNLIVYGKEGDHYLVSDPVMENVASLTAYELERVRFAKGTLAPKGQLYYPNAATEINDARIKKGIISGIKSNTSVMLQPIMPVVGVKGIKYMGNRIKNWRDKYGLKQAGLYLAQLVRMQEEIGTGGGGFRYIYGAFLQEAYAYHPVEELMTVSEMFTNSGDLWRTAAVQAAGIYKGRLGTQEDFNVMGNHLLEIAEIEYKAFTALKKIKWH
jgi:hypothetical protein